MTDTSQTPAPASTTPALAQAPLPGPEQLNDLRRRVLAGEQPPTEELAAAIRAIRQGRKHAMETKAKKAKKTGEAAVAELDDLLGGLGL